MNRCDGCGLESIITFNYNGRRLCEACFSNCDFDLKDRHITELQQENAKLKEQLKNAIVPKYKVGDEVYYLAKNHSCIYSSKIEAIKIQVRRGIGIQYRLLSNEGYKNYRNECDLFATEADAQKYLEEHK